MRCLVIDDEPLARDLIDGYIRKTPFLESAGSFSNPFKAMAWLQQNRVDLLFLDINMPELTGIQLLKSLLDPPCVVFTTAHAEFGAESYEYGAVDYLLKPVRYERFLKAVNKAQELASLRSGRNEPQKEPVPAHQPTIMIKSGTKTIPLRTDQILYIEADGNYMIFHTRERKILSLLSISELLGQLPADQFLRIHKSFVVNVNQIDFIEKYRVVINKTPIPIGVTYRGQVFQDHKSRH